jgi:hypothetical protein
MCFDERNRKWSRTISSERSQETIMIRCNPWSFICCLFVLPGLVSCASTEWESEVGTYTYGDAVMAYGHPDKCEKSAEGNKTCSWKITAGKNRYIDKDTIVLVFDPEEKLKSGQSIPRDSRK